MHADQKTEMVEGLKALARLFRWPRAGSRPAGRASSADLHRQQPAGGSRSTVRPGPVLTRAPRPPRNPGTQPCLPHLRSPPATGRPVSGDQRGPPHTRTSARTKWWPHSFSGPSAVGARPSVTTRAELSSTSAQGSGRGSIAAGSA